MCIKFKEDPRGDFSMDVPPRPVSMRGPGAPPPRGPRHWSQRSSQVLVVEERSPHTSGHFGRRISVSERSPHTSGQLVHRVSVTERSPRTSRNRLSATHHTVSRSPRSSGRLLSPNYVELPRADPLRLPAPQAEPTFVETREPPPPPEAPEPPPAAHASRSSSVRGERDHSRARAHSSARYSDYLSPQQSPPLAPASPRASAASMERQGSGQRTRAESTSRHERRSSRDRPRSRYAEEAERLSREPSQNRQRDSRLYLEDGRQTEGARMVEERIIHGENRTTKQYYYV